MCILYVTGTVQAEHCEKAKQLKQSDTKTIFDSGGGGAASGSHLKQQDTDKNGRHSESRGGFVRELLSSVLSEADPDVLLWQERSEDFKKQSKLMLKMIYFFQVLPFYLLQFCSGMGVGEFVQYILEHLRPYFWTLPWLS